MSNLMACRMCLALDTRLYSLSDTPLQETYEKITNLSLQTTDGRSVMACHICHHLLKKCQWFMEKSVRADQLLSQILNSGLQLTENSISLVDKSQVSSMLEVTPTEIMSFASEVATVEVPVKDECKVKTEIEIDMKEAEDGVLSPEEPEPIQQDVSHSSESEDDIPLHKIKLEKKEVRLDKRRVRKKEGLKAVALEIILTKEEQLKQMMERSKSLNYLNSPYKCNLCYKGFVETKAFENHKEKHDESSGQFECDICRMRYATARHLRTHALTSHARQFACGKCPHRSHTANQAREHEKWHNGYTYECQLCSQKFRKPTSYLTHMRKRHPTSHVCRACGESFVGRHGLLMHTSKAHKRGDEKSTGSQTFCSECNIQFASLEAWKRHILSSIKHALGGESSSTCLACGEALPAGASLREHVRAHAPPPAPPPPPPAPPAPPAAQLPCDQCGANFVNRSKLQAHIKRIHLGLKYNKNIVCEVCGKKCTSNASLKYHQRTHTGERPYACTQCPKRFADNNQLRIHVRTHTGERPYCCAVCGKSFSQKPALNRHYRVHTGAKPYDCQFCPKTFSQSNSLKLHVNTVHLKLPHAKKKPVADQQDL